MSAKKSGPMGPLLKEQEASLFLWFHQLFALSLHFVVGLGGIHLVAGFYLLVVFHGAAVRAGDRAERDGRESRCDQN
jgi:hypothetical protein